MRRLLIALLLSSAVTLSACGGASSVGRGCTADSDCDNAQQCDLGAPGGYCTRACSADGKVTDCPGGSVCTTIGTQLRCATICKEQVDCRADYECNGVTGSDVKACKPKSK